MKDDAVQQAWREFLERMGLKDEEMTLSEKLLFNVAFEKGRKWTKTTNGSASSKRNAS